MVDRIHVTDNFGQMPKDKRFAKRGEWRDRARSGSPRTFISPKELEESMRHPTWSDGIRPPKDWRVSFTVPGPSFWQKLITDFAQWALGDRVLIIDRSRIIDSEKYQAELERLWSERKEGTISKPTVIQLQIALEDEDDGRPATSPTRTGHRTVA